MPSASQEKIESLIDSGTRYGSCLKPIDEVRTESGMPSDPQETMKGITTLEKSECILDGRMDIPITMTKPTRCGEGKGSNMHCHMSKRSTDRSSNHRLLTNAVGERSSGKGSVMANRIEDARHGTAYKGTMASDRREAIRQIEIARSFFQKKNTRITKKTWKSLSKRSSRTATWTWSQNVMRNKFKERST